jgi:hypothetical protein
MNAGVSTLIQVLDDSTRCHTFEDPEITLENATDLLQLSLEFKVKSYQVEIQNFLVEHGRPQ